MIDQRWKIPQQPSLKRVGTICRHRWKTRPTISLGHSCVFILNLFGRKSQEGRASQPSLHPCQTVLKTCPKMSKTQPQKSSLLSVLQQRHCRPPRTKGEHVESAGSGAPKLSWSDEVEEEDLASGRLLASVIDESQELHSKLLYTTPTAHKPGTMTMLHVKKSC